MTDKEFIEEMRIAAQDYVDRMVKLMQQANNKEIKTDNYKDLKQYYGKLLQDDILKIVKQYDNGSYLKFKILELKKNRLLKEILKEIEYPCEARGE